MNELKTYWDFDTELIYLNHGSFGACPTKILDIAENYRRQMERELGSFILEEQFKLLENSRISVADLLKGKTDQLAFIPNASYGVNSVIRSLSFSDGDEIIVTDHEYNACFATLDYVAKRFKAKLIVVRIPFPLPINLNQANKIILNEIAKHFSSRTKLLFIDHISSQTGLIFPIKDLATHCRGKGVELLVDGAHVPGQLMINMEELCSLGVSYYIGNFHKWMCAPKSSAFLYVTEDKLEKINPLTISHGYNTNLPEGKSRFQSQFEWIGTLDNSSVYVLPKLIDYLEKVSGMSLTEMINRNHKLLLEGRKILCSALDVEIPTHDEMVGSMASIPLPDGKDLWSNQTLYRDELQDLLLEEEKILSLVVPWPAPPKRLLRLSAHIYNNREDYIRLANAVQKLLD